jgi:hypothetical protein
MVVPKHYQAQTMGDGLLISQKGILQLFQMNEQAL